MVPVPKLVPSTTKAPLKPAALSAAAAEQHVGEGQRQWEDYCNAFLNCKFPFDCTKDPTHCPAPPTPALCLPGPAPNCSNCPSDTRFCGGDGKCHTRYQQGGEPCCAGLEVPGEGGFAAVIELRST